MNNRGQLLIYSFMLGITVIVLALALGAPVKEVVDDARNATVGDVIGMDCGNESISNFQKAGCLASDLSIFYFIGTLIVIAGGLLGAKVLIGGDK